MRYFPFLMLLFIFACQGNANNGIPDKEAGHTRKVSNNDSIIEKESDDPIIEEKDIDSTVVEGAIGFIVASKKYNFGDVISILDKNMNIIDEIVLKEETEVLALKCLSRTVSLYKVLLNNGSEGYILTKEQKVKFQSWQEHILNSLFAVDFNSKNNPIHKNPSKDSETINYSRDEFYHPYQIKGDWLQVKWGSASRWNYGWIRWRNKETLLIEMFYFA